MSHYEHQGRSMYEDSEIAGVIFEDGTEDGAETSGDDYPPGPTVAFIADVYSA
jgi:hypothetical protein